jgi:hypothetical protein
MLAIEPLYLHTLQRRDTQELPQGQAKPTRAISYSF